MSNGKIWYLPGPFHQYQEDVKALAKAHGLRIIDANATSNREGAATDVPEVTTRELAEAVVLVGGDIPGSVVDTLRAELESIGVIVELFAGQELARPDGELGPIAERLFQVLDASNAGLQSLINERDGEVAKVVRLSEEITSLQSQVAEFQAAVTKGAGSDPVIEGLKAKLTAANVAFRANASQESLEKLVAELSKE